jgi:3-oxoacyl-[acyl-carrier protein] reductase
MITGGSHGLGKQAAGAIAREGCKIAICARGAEQLEETRQEFDNLGYQVVAVQADVTAQEDLARFHEETVAALGQCDILVNNVGGRRGSATFW